jgi:hypothetical protein
MRIKFKKNMSNLDRAIRTVVGLTLVTAGPVTGFITPDKLSSILMGIVGSLALVSAFFSYCILYEFTGFGSGKESEQSR